MGLLRWDGLVSPGNLNRASKSRVSNPGAQEWESFFSLFFLTREVHPGNGENACVRVAKIECDGQRARGIEWVVDGFQKCS